MTGTDNIYENFAVTEKADGERKLLMVVQDKAYFIVSGNLEVEYTGISGLEKMNNVLIDGEHVTMDKTHTRINSYFAFDIYYNGKKDGDIRAMPFIGPEDHRLKQLNHIVKKFPITNLVISAKIFVESTPDSCGMLLDKIAEGGFPYETDGLIFTPALYGVGMSKTVTSLPKEGTDWYLNLKWKPLKTIPLISWCTLVKMPINLEWRMSTPIKK